MMNTVKKTACILAVLATTPTVVMAESIDVKVTGTITPAACTPTLSGGGTTDYGVIPPASLNKDTFTVLDEKQLDFSITCDAPVKVAIQATGTKADTSTDRSGTATSGYHPFSGELFGVKSVNVAGLGKAGNGKNIGGYGIRLVPGTYTADGSKADTLRRNTISDAWSSSADYDAGSVWSFESKNTQLTWARPGEKVPVAFTAVAGTLGVQAYITRTSGLDLTKPIKLDGLATLELVYL